MSGSQEQEPLLTSGVDDAPGPFHNWPSSLPSTRERLARRLESKWTHRAIISLIVIDSILILIDLSYTYLSESCKHPELERPYWVEALGTVSLAITVAFMAEMALFAFACGVKYYLHSFLHFVDGAIIIASFVIEVVLKGRERELAELIVMFRLIRFAAEAAVGVGEVNEETERKLEETETELKNTKAALEAAQEEINQLKAELAERGGSL